MREPELTDTDGRRAILIWGGTYFLRVAWVFPPDFPQECESRYRNLFRHF